jgi:hypothetical protein
METQLGPIDMLLIFGGIVSKILLIAFAYLGIITIVDKLRTVPYGKFTLGIIVFWFVVGGIYEYKKHRNKQD